MSSVFFFFGLFRKEFSSLKKYFSNKSVTCPKFHSCPHFVSSVDYAQAAGPTALLC